MREVCRLNALTAGSRGEPAMRDAREQLAAALRDLAEAAERARRVIDAGPELSPGTETAQQGVEDRLLTAAEVAAYFRRSVAWVYRNAHRWPFTRREGRKTVRFSEQELRRYSAGRRT